MSDEDGDQLGEELDDEPDDVSYPITNEGLHDIDASMEANIGTPRFCLSLSQLSSPLSPFCAFSGSTTGDFESARACASASAVIPDSAVQATLSSFPHLSLMMSFG